MCPCHDDILHIHPYSPHFQSNSISGLASVLLSHHVWHCWKTRHPTKSKNLLLGKNISLTLHFKRGYIKCI